MSGEGKGSAVRRSELMRAIDDEFGALGAVLFSDLGLPELGGRTAVEALADGEHARAVWNALCVQAEVPASRRHGVGMQNQEH